MNKVNIFEATKEKKMPVWAKFENAGDSIQGTYVGKITGSLDGYGNLQVIYQLLKDGEVYNVGFGENKKVIIQDMAKANFGQIVGFKYKGRLSVKNKLGKIVEVKDFGLFIDPKIVDEGWLKENAQCMPETTHVDSVGTRASKTSNEETEKAFQEFSNFGASEGSPAPSTSAPSSVTPEDKLAIITKLAHDKLGVSDPAIMKDKVMEITGIAFLPANFDRIISVLNTIGA